MEIDSKVVEAARAAFPAGGKAVTLGAPVHEGACLAEPLVSIPLAMVNRHGLIAGATGTGKTKTLQLIAEQLSARRRAGVPRRRQGRRRRAWRLPGEPSDRVDERATDTGYAWKPLGLPGRVPEPDGQARRAAARDGVVVRPAAARQGARPERDADQRARDGVQVLRRPGAAAARLRGPARGAAVPRRRRRRGAQGVRRHVEGDRRRAAARDGRARSSRAPARSSASPSSTSTT